ncbi:hypothetical protein M8494_27925 [Serratia ureilytica]
MIAREARRRGLKDNIKLARRRHSRNRIHHPYSSRSAAAASRRCRGSPPDAAGGGGAGLLEAEQARRAPPTRSCGGWRICCRRSAISKTQIAAADALDQARGLAYGMGLRIAGADGDAGGAHAGGAGGVRRSDRRR